MDIIAEFTSARIPEIMHRLERLLTSTAPPQPDLPESDYRLLIIDGLADHYDLVCELSAATIFPNRPISNEAFDASLPDRYEHPEERVWQVWRRYMDKCRLPFTLRDQAMLAGITAMYAPILEREVGNYIQLRIK